MIITPNGQSLQSEEGWKIISCPTSNNLRDVVFVNETHGWIIGENGTCLWTNSSGRNWYVYDVSNSLFSNENLIDIDFVPNQDGLMISENSAFICRNNTMVWEKIYLPYTPKLFSCVLSPNGVKCIAANNSVYLNISGWGDETISGWSIDTIDANLTTMAMITNNKTMGISEKAIYRWFISNGGFVSCSGESAIFRYKNVFGIPELEVIHLLGEYNLSKKCSMNTEWYDNQSNIWRDRTDNMEQVQGEMFGSFYKNKENGWCIGHQGAIWYRYIWTGQWVKQLTPTQRTLRKIDFYDDWHGIVVGDNGTILLTETGGNRTPKGYFNAVNAPLYNTRDVHFVVTVIDGESPFGFQWLFEEDYMLGTSFQRENDTYYRYSEIGNHSVRLAIQDGNQDVFVYAANITIISDNRINGFAGIFIICIGSVMYLLFEKKKRIVGI